MHIFIAKCNIYFLISKVRPFEKGGLQSSSRRSERQGHLPSLLHHWNIIEEIAC